MTTDLGVTWRLGAWGDASRSAAAPTLGRAPESLGGTRLGGTRWRRARGPLFWVSLALHLTVILALVLELPKPQQQQDDVGPPSVSVVLGPSDTSVAPTPQAAIGTPNAPTVERAAPPDAAPPPPPPSAAATATPSPTAPSPPPPAVAALAPPRPAPSQAQTPPAQEQPSPPAASVPTEANAEPLPVPPIPPAVQPPSPPPIREALVQPPPLPQARPSPPSRPAPEPRREAPPAHYFVPPRPSSQSNAFPMPIFGSLSGALSPTPHATRTPSREMAGPVNLGSSNNSFKPQYDLSGDNLGPGWVALFKRWVNEHKYYPDEAARNGEEGDAAVSFTLGRDGRVSDVHLVQRSGSEFLDLALQALFRGQRLPPMPPDFPKDQAVINVTMHYYLIRG